MVIHNDLCIFPICIRSVQRIASHISFNLILLGTTRGQRLREWKVDTKIPFRQAVVLQFPPIKNLVEVARECDDLHRVQGLHSFPGSQSLILGTEVPRLAIASVFNSDTGITTYMAGKQMNVGWSQSMKIFKHFAFGSLYILHCWKPLLSQQACCGHHAACK